MNNLQLENPPSSGVNIWVMASARRCQIAGLCEAEAESRIMAYQGQARRPLKQSEIKRAISKAYSTEYKPTHAAQPKQKWEPSTTRQTAYKRNSKGITAYDLWESSPIRIDDGVTQTMILNWLFPDPNALICVGQSAFKFHTARLNQFKDLSQCQFIVPCYMTKPKGLTQDGKESMHCLDNCGDRRYFVCDFDEPKSADHPSIIMRLKRTFDLVMVLSSGGKSLHAWFNIDSDEQESFWEVAIEYGADPALMRNRSSFVRIPYGTRDNGKKQEVLYFDIDKCVGGSHE